MIRRILTWVLVGIAILLFGRLLRLLGRGARRAAPRGGQDGSTQLVRDRVCNTFIPRNTALFLKASGETLYFCSPECRSRYVDRTSGPPGASALAS